jgi:hypothetical protein
VELAMSAAELVAAASYATCPIKRVRRTKAEMQVIQDGLVAILSAAHPMSVRQVFYRAVTRGLVDKTEAEYQRTVVRLLTDLRRDNIVPFDWITDSTRWMRRPRTHNSMAEALRLTAETYRRALWQDLDVTVEVWLEKDALAGVLFQVTAQYDVPLMVTRGYPSLTFLQSAAEEYESDVRDVYIYYFGDWDPSGKDISRVVERDLRELAPTTNIIFDRVAVTEEQITSMSLPTRPTKKTDTRAKHFTGESVEVDAIPPKDLRFLAQLCIKQHLDQEVLAANQVIEDQERDAGRRFVETFGGGR